MSLGDRLRQRRQHRQLTQEELAKALGVSSRTVSRWEQDLAIPRTHMRRQLCRILEMNLGDFEESPSPSLLWTVPFAQNPCFTGREEILDLLHTRLMAERPIALTQAAAISGLGGIGKTQVAIEYAYRYARQYCAVFWLSAETSEDLMRSLQQIANLLQLPEREAAEQIMMVAAVRQWLATHSGWLLIADNMEDLDLLQTILPPTRPGSLLLTTRRQALGTLAEPVELPPMSLEEGITLLFRRARLLSMAGAAIPEEMLKTPAMTEARQLVTQLEGLPLALDQAGAYIEETGCGVADFLQRYHHQRQLVLARRGLHKGEHPASIAATLRLSVEYVAQHQPAAEDLLRVCAFLHAEAIPEELFREGASHLGPILGAVATDAYQFDLVLAALRSASLVTRSPETQTLSVHRLVQAVLQDQMDPAKRRLWSERVVRIVNAIFPDGDFGTWEQCERYLLQAHSVASLSTWIDEALPEMGELLTKAGRYLMRRGRFEDAAPLLSRAVTLGEQHYGLDRPELLPSLMVQSELAWRQGKFADTEKLLLRLLSIEELHPTSPLILPGDTPNNLALLYWEQGKYEQAKPLYNQALHTQETRLGPNHQEVAATLNNLALLYWRQGRYEQAENLYQRASQIEERTLPPGHPKFTPTFNNLGMLYCEMGRYEQAASLLQKARQISEQALGAEHHLVGDSLIILGLLSRLQGQYEQAENLYQRALQIREQGLGTEHPMVGKVLSEQAMLRTAQERYEQAEALFQRALQIQEQKLGPNHPEIMLSLIGQAMLRTAQERYEQAEALFQRALQICEQVLGSGHPHMARVLGGLATVYAKQGRDQQARPLYERALHQCEQHLGAAHPQTRKIRSDYERLREKN
ncbi:MAG TPA: FxSxx-COOH system tetratricopeptide repeat protein [Ktedonobacteraceae bacterium]|jgi:tetratricopeptide (TPR) repeat protein/DNA-binding XRE family transcriptional regulator|nr:FxSxx-COOH system tetratricopeptide repeat protein [Ktedonobacteraceae bacterium]